MQFLNTPKVILIIHCHPLLYFFSGPVKCITTAQYNTHTEKSEMLPYIGKFALLRLKTTVLKSWICYYVKMQPMISY